MRLLSLALATAAVSAHGAPKYLSVEGFRDCTAENKQETFTSLCMPTVKPEACSDASWAQLIEIDEFPACPVQTE